MTGIGWTVPLCKKYDICLSFSWWNPLNKIEFRKSFYFNRENMESTGEIIFSYILAFICIDLKFEIFRNGGKDE